MRKLVKESMSPGWDWSGKEAISDAEFKLGIVVGGESGTEEAFNKLSGEEKETLYSAWMILKKMEKSTK